MSIPPVVNQEAQFAGWMGCFHALMMKPLPLVRAVCAWARSCEQAIAPACAAHYRRLGAAASPPSHSHTPMPPPAPPPCPCPQDQLPADPDARKSWQWSKAKKWVMHITSRLFNRYGDPKLCQDKEVGLWGVGFVPR